MSIENLSMESLKKDDKSKPKYFFWFLVIGCLIVGITICYGLVINFVFENSDGKGIFGDMYGALNALFSGLAFAGVIVTILMQMKELEITREEMKKSVVAQNETQKALNKQLNSMQFGTKLESVSSYINSHNANEESDNRVIAKYVLKKMTEEIFVDEVYFPITKPNIEIQGKDETDFNIKLDENGMFESVQIPLKNIGAGFKLVHDIVGNSSGNKLVNVLIRTISSKGAKMIKQIEYNEEIGRNLKFKLVLRDLKPNTEYQYLFHMLGVVAEHQWIQKLTINTIETQLALKIGEPAKFDLKY